MINLLPPDVKQSVKFAKYNVYLIQYTFVIIVSIIIMMGLMFYGKMSLETTKSDLESALSTDQGRIAELKSVNDEATELSKKIDTIGNILDKEVKFSYLLREIGSVMPDGSVLSAITLSLDTTKPIRFSVLFDTEVKVGVLQQNIVESDLFLGADIINVTKAPSTSGYQYSGELQAYYDPAMPLNTLDDPAEEETEVTP